MHWKFVTEHTFFRYDKLCKGQGKFSTRMVKVLVYQKTDHNVWVQMEKQRLEEEASLAQAEEDRVNEINQLRNKKLNGGQNERK